MSKLREGGVQLVPFKNRGNTGRSLIRNATLRAPNAASPPIPQGEIHSTLPALTQLVIGTFGEDVAGGIVQTLPPLTQASATTVVPGGPIVQTLPALTASAAASVAARAIISQMLPALRQAAEGSTGPDVSGGVIQTLPSFTQALVAIVVPGAAIVQTLPALTQAAAAIRSDHADITQVLPKLTQSSAGITIGGEIEEQVLPALTQLVEAISTGGFIAQILPRLFQGSGGSGNVDGTIASTLPALRSVAFAHIRIPSALYDPYLQSSSQNLVTIEGMSAFLGVPIDDADFLANLMCSIASDVVREYTGQTIHFVNNDIVMVDGTGTASLLLPQMPVVRVNAITTYDDHLLNEHVLPTTEFILGDAGILWNTNGGWPLGHRNVRVSYDHGWDVGELQSSPLPEDNTSVHVPAVILLVALRIAARGFLSGSTVGSGAGDKHSESIGSYSYTNETSQTAVTAAVESARQITADEAALLDPFVVQSLA